VSEDEFPEQIRLKLSALRASGVKAKDAEDYDLMRTLKQAEDLLVQQGIRVIKLLEIKRIAIENEDYQTAKLIKEGIERTYAAIGSIDEETGQIDQDFVKNLQPIAQQEEKEYAGINQTRLEKSLENLSQRASQARGRSSNSDRSEKYEKNYTTKSQERKL